MSGRNDRTQMFANGQLRTTYDVANAHNLKFQASPSQCFDLNKSIYENRKTSAKNGNEETNQMRQLAEKHTG